MKKSTVPNPVRYKRSPLLALGIASAALFCVTQTVVAAEWRLQPELRLGYEYDDNATLNSTPTSTLEIQGYILEGAATVGYASERTTFDITPRLRSRNYGTTDDIFDSDDQFLRLDLRHRGLKSNFTIRADYGKESIRTAERASADPGISDPDEIFGDETSRVFSPERRETIRVRPRWSYNFSEKSEFTADAIFTEVDYDDVAIEFLVPYVDFRFRASLARDFSAVSKGYIRASARSYEPEDIMTGTAVDVDGLALNIGFEHRPSETTLIRAEIGTEQSEPAGGDSDDNLVWNLSFVKNTQTVTMLAQYKRSITASGNGSLSERDALNITLSRSFSERLTGGLAVRAYSSDRLNGIGTALGERDYVQFGARLEYALSRAFSVQADYRYTDLDRAAAIGSADSNNVFVWLIYRPNAWRASR